MKMKDTSRKAFEAWWAIHHEDATNYRDSFEAGWQASHAALRADPVQAVEPVAYLIDWPDEPELGHYFSESATESGRSTPPFTHPAPPATGERAELIAGLREHATFMCIEGAEKQRTLKAADMLEADAQEIKRLEQCRIDEAETTNKAAQASRDLLTKALNQAQQVAVPDGWALVPVEPTPAMSAAGFCVAEADHDPAGVYRAMLAAAQGAKPVAQQVAVPTKKQTPVFTGCIFYGNPPAGFGDWFAWASQKPMTGVRIEAITQGAKP